MNSGKMGEDIVCEFLRRKGYDIIERNYHSRYGEIDILAKDGDVWVFVEVKTRKSSAFGTPAEYVTAAKMKKIIKTAFCYLNGTECEMRFDVAEVLYGRELKINYIENAFGGGYEIFDN